MIRHRVVENTFARAYPPADGEGGGIGDGAYGRPYFRDDSAAAAPKVSDQSLRERARLLDTVRVIDQLNELGTLDPGQLRDLSQWLQAGGGSGIERNAFWQGVLGNPFDPFGDLGIADQQRGLDAVRARNQRPGYDWQDEGRARGDEARAGLGLGRSLVTQGPGTNDVAGSSWIEDFLALFGISLGNSIDGGVREDYRQAGSVEPEWVPDRGPRDDAGHMDAGVWRDPGPDDGTAAIEQFIATYGIGAGQNIHRWDAPPKRPIVYVRPADDARGSEAPGAPTFRLPLADEPWRRRGLDDATRAQARRRLEERLSRLLGPEDRRGGTRRP